MRITKYIHSCLLIEKDSDRLLFDPGNFTFLEGRFAPADFRDIRAVVVTHYHPDHLDDEALRVILENNPRALVLANRFIVDRLAAKDISAEVFESGERRVGDFLLKAFEAPQEKILADEIPPNTAFTIDDEILHPGDSLSRNLHALRGTPVLCLPVAAPWLTEPAAYEFAAALEPRTIVPIHDGFLKDFFLKSRYQNFQRHFERIDIQFRRMIEPGDFCEV
ncbi:MAG: MBL fold metallo-hydrolase [Acidobacteria bacterium]|nr:MBL fold metallo-hydrolase [Acidobacteriota bacterium]